MSNSPKTLPEALDVIRAMHKKLITFRCPEFMELIKDDAGGKFDDAVKDVLALSAPLIRSDREQEI